MSEEYAQPSREPAQPFVPRPAQARILEYGGGPMGVSAVPGSGKTFTLSLLAARLVEQLAGEEPPGEYADEREVLVVTFTNSAVENFRSRIGTFVHREQGLLPGVGYRVRTLHGLAHDIVRERPSLVNLSETFDIIDERTANKIKREAALAYLRTHPDVFAPYIKPEYLQNFRRIERYLLDDAIDIANLVIRVGKEFRAEPHELQARLRQQSGTWPLLAFGLHVYADYQRSLSIRGAVDFDDLIVLALRALAADENYLIRLQDRWPYVLEDEAQDSSALQEEMLRLLTARHGNWVRVGDPNQAINTTFTSADTRFLQQFIARYPDQSRDLPNSGRSALPIIELANYLIDWSRTQHPVLPSELALAPPYIEPTPPHDPQPNPQPGEPAVFFFDRAMTPENETDVIITSLKRWLPQHEGQTVAVLVPENSRGFHLTEALRQVGLPYDDSLLRSDSATRAAAQALAVVLSYIAQPEVSTHLERVWLEVWWPRGMARRQAEMSAGDENAHEPSAATADAPIPEPVAAFGDALRRLREPETFLFPAQHDWLGSLSWLDGMDDLREIVDAFRLTLRRWTAAMVLPVDELLLTVGNDLFNSPADLALTHRLALLLAKLSAEQPHLRIPELAGELENIAQNRRRILGFSEEGMGFEPKPGQVTVATMHAAKGLEWDRVY
ncbi:MAG: ATP-dependent helicase, partial [Caldilineaceae bacterium]|nr:ATP-dependent helicase [Caldilineaceae bacterium]